MTRVPQATEELLIQQAKSGCLNAWEQLVVRNQARLLDYVRYRYDDRLAAYISAEDILQEAILRAWLDIESLQCTTPTSFFAWMKAIADRRMNDTLKTQQRLKRGGEFRIATWNPHDSASWFDLLDALPSEAHTASSVLSKKETVQSLQVAVSRLPEDQGTAVQLRFLEGLTLGETATEMNRTVPAVRGLLHRGKQQLARDLTSASRCFRVHTDASPLHAGKASQDQQAAVDDERSASTRPKELIGQTVAHYQIIEWLGAGAMGVVYRAKDTNLSRDVALKFLPEEVTRNARAVERFTREARATSALNHPNIVTIHEIAVEGDMHFIVMELVEGRTLQAMLPDCITITKVKELGAQAARALAVAHAAGIVHRDIKPKNVMVRDDGYVKILDFGLARLMPERLESLDEATNDSNTGSGVVVGTVRYMSPEQTRGVTVGPASDVFALGIVLYEMSTRQHPFEAVSHQAITRQIQTDSPLPPSRLNPEVSFDLECLIIEMLHKDPQLRPSAREIETRLIGLGGQVDASPPTRQENWAAPSFSRHMVGREKPTAALRAELESARSGQGRLVCVTGEPGIGKTTLVNEFVEQLNTERISYTYARGICSERLAGAEAYLPILELLEHFSREGGETVARTLRVLAPTWYVRVVSLSNIDSSAERVLTDARTASQERMKRELHAFFEELCRTRPIVLVLEDVHWADVSTVDLLAYIGSKLDSMPLLIVATYRPTELMLGDHVLARIKLELQGRGLCHELSLDLLTRGDIDKYLALEFPQHRFPVEFAELIHTRTEGSPLFIVDLLRFFRDRRVVIQKAGRWELAEPIAGIADEIPESVRSMVQKKINQLTDDDRRLLTVASVQGYEFEATVVAKALEWDEIEVEERLESLDGVHALVRPVGEHEFPDHTLTLRYTFVHSLYQNSLYGAQSPARRAQASAAVAEALLGLYGKQAATIASELAFLYEEARSFLQSADHFILAAQNAAALYANHEAVELTQRAIASAERLEGRHRHKRILMATLQLGKIHVTLSQFEEAVDDFAQAEKAARACEDHKNEVDAICYSGICQLYRKRPDEMATQGRRALELARTRKSDVGVAFAEYVLAQERLCVGALASAEDYLDRSVPVLKREGTPEQLLKAYPAAGMLHTWRLEYEQAHRIFDWAVQKSRDLGASMTLLQCLFFKGMTLGNQGRLSDAIAVLQEGIRLAELNGERFFLSRLPNTLGWIHREAQDIETALRLDSENVAMAREMGFQEAEANSLVNLGHDYLSLGELDQAFGHFQQAATIYEQDVWFRWRHNTRLQAELARYWILRGSLETAARHATSSLKTAEVTQSPKYIAWAHKVLGDIASLEDRVEDAKREYGIALQTVDAHPCPTTHWRILAARADLARKLKDTTAIEEFHGLARKVIQGLAESIREKPLRQTFLTSKAIRELSEDVGYRA